MAKTVQQILANHAAHVARSVKGLTVAQENSNYQLAALNCRQALQSRLMQGLITWRCANNPTPYFEEATYHFAEDWRTLQQIGRESARLSDADYQQVLYITYLVDQPIPFTPQSIAPEDLPCDRVLDAVIGEWLYGIWNSPLWETAMADLQEKGSKLAVETYDFYRRVAQSTGEDLLELEARVHELFLRRRGDKFFAGGVRTSGGGPDNDITVDFRFAALMKRMGIPGDSLHTWRW